MIWLAGMQTKQAGWNRVLYVPCSTAGRCCIACFFYLMERTYDADGAFKQKRCRVERRMIMCKMKEWTETLTDVVAMTKKEYILTIAASLLGGIVIGFVFAPRRIKHTTIGSHNGNECPKDCFEDWEDSDDMEYMDDTDDMEEEDLSF